MKTLSFRIPDKTYEKLNDLKKIWNEKDSKTDDFNPYTTTDIINLCIGMIWEIENNQVQKKGHLSNLFAKLFLNE